MPVDPAQLLDQLSELGITPTCYSHPPVHTVEAQVAALKNTGVEAAYTKNLFLKDKKNRFYIVSTHADTKVDLKVLSSRLGLGKSGIRFAPQENLGPILELQPGSVTPFAVCQPTAANVVLLVDNKLQQEPSVVFHPLTNEKTIVVSTSQLDQYLSSVGRTAHYVDLEAQPTIDKDTPPDLQSCVANVVAGEGLAGYSAGIADSASQSSLASTSSNISTKSKSVVSNKGKPRDNGSTALADVDHVAAAVLKKVLTLTESSGATVDAEAQRRFHADVMVLLGSLRNNSYANGFRAAKDQISSVCSARGCS